jgi:hypothetical protein
MLAKKNHKLTSVKVNVDSYNEFKINSIKDGISFQELVNKTLELYNNSADFKEKYFTNHK